MIGPQRSMPSASAFPPGPASPRPTLRAAADVTRVRSCGRTQAGVSRWLRRGERSAVAVELGIIAIPFFMTFLGIMEMSYDLYVQAALNNAVEVAARSVQVGSQTGNSGENSNTFIAAAVCPNLGGLLDCSLLTVGVAPIPTGFNYFSLPVQRPANPRRGNRRQRHLHRHGRADDGFKSLVRWSNLRRPAHSVFQHDLQRCLDTCDDGLLGLR